MSDAHTIREFVFPSYVIAYNTRKFNLTYDFGYSDHKHRVSGLLVEIESDSQVETELKKDATEPIFLILPMFIFINKHSMTIIISNSRVVGIMVVLSEKINNLTVKFFNELPNCIQTNLKLCAGDDNGIYSKGYFYKQWKIPIVLLKKSLNYHEIIHKCYKRYNVNKKNRQRCFVEVYHYGTKRLDYSRCLRWQTSWRKYFWLTKSYEYCKSYNGYNIYVTFNKVKSFVGRSVILIYTKTDTISMFDTAAHGVRELYPSISTMIYMAKMLKQAALEKFLDPNSDILMAFVDNYDVEQLGTTRLLYDLKNNRINNTIHNITDKNIKLIIFLGELNPVTKTLTFITRSCNANELCKQFKDLFVLYAKKYSISLRNQDIENRYDKMSIWKSIPVPTIEIKSSVVSQNLFERTFLDIEKPKELNWLANYSNAIFFTLIKLIISKELTTEFIPVPSEFSPMDFVTCIFNVSCKPFQWIIGPAEKWLYGTYASPFIAQSFINELIDVKDQQYLNRLSFFVLKLLVILLKDKEVPLKDCPSYNSLQYFETKINDRTVCLETRIQMERYFNFDQLINLSEKSKDYDFVPHWKKITLYKEQSVRLFISQDPEVGNTIMVIYTIFFVLCLLASLFLYRSIHVFISEDVF